MNNNATHFRGLGLALSLGLGLLVLSLLLAARSLDVIVDPRVSHWIQAQQIFGRQLIGPFVLYGCNLLLIHLAFSLIVWLLAAMSEKSMNAWRWSRSRHVVAWFCLLTFWLLLANATFFPWSNSTAPLRILVQPVLGSVTTFDLVTGGLVLIVLMGVWRFQDFFPASRRIAPRVVLYGLAVVGAIQAWQWMRIDAAINDPVSATARPNIVIVGIDSLRPDFVGAAQQELGYTPELDVILKDSHLFTDAITPLGRTFAAWISILTGRAPIHTGVRDNLVPRSLSSVGPTLAERLRNVGYHTIYATDEVRFSYVDQSYGFDQVIGPRMGITDFLLGTVNDLPLTNLVSGTWVGKQLFPNTYANRAAATTYRPETFVHWVESDIRTEGPTFLAVHLTLPHHPYHWMDDEDAVFARTTDHKYEYTASVVAADRQFGQLMAALQRRGMLRNTIMVILSDHGEGLGLVRDNAIYSKEAKLATGRVRVSMNGHGNSVLSPPQYSVVLAFRGFGPAQRLVGPGRRLDVPVSLEDVTPTLLELSGSQVDPAQFDGESLASLFNSRFETPAELGDRVRFTETGFPVDFNGGAHDGGQGLVKEAVDLYQVDVETGRVEMRKETIPALLRKKERAAIQGEWMLAAIPDDLVGTTFVLVNRRGDALPLLLDEEQAKDHPDAVNLWRSLRARYGDEIVLYPALSGDTRAH